MKAREKIKKLVASIGPEPLTQDGLLVFAYFMGREAASRELCDAHNRRVAAMRTAAAKERYHRLAHRVISAGGPDMIHSHDYAQDVTATFGGDEV